MRLMMKVIGSFLLATTVYAGHELDNGVENYLADNSHAWFTGTRTVNYCYLMGENFGVGAAVVEREIEASVATWRDYFEIKGLPVDNEIEKNEMGGKTVERGYATQFRLQACDGRQDLTFYFGSNSAETLPFRENQKKSLALAEMTQFDEASGWGRGFIWVSPTGHISEGYPNWSVSPLLRSILLHELGHVYGARHAKGTIMSEQLSDGIRLVSLGSRSEALKARLIRIDGSFELTKGVKESLDLEGADEEVYGAPLLAQGCRWIMERECKGAIRTHAQAPHGIRVSPTLPHPEVLYTLEDDLGRIDLKIRVDVRVASLDRGWQLVRLIFGWSPSMGAFAFRNVASSASEAVVGTATNEKGRSLSFIVARNLTNEVTLNAQGMPHWVSSRLAIMGYGDSEPNRVVFASDADAGFEYDY